MILATQNSPLNHHFDAPFARNDAKSGKKSENFKPFKLQ